MAITTREAVEKGTETFNARDIDGFAAVLADEVVFKAPGGIEGRGRKACIEFLRRLDRGLSRRPCRG